MNRIERELLDKAIKKYKLGEYSESDFHSSFEAAIGLLSEAHLLQLRRKFESIEAELEEIDFLSKNKRDAYLKQIEKIEKLL